MKQEPNPNRDKARDLARQIAKLSDSERRARAPSLPIATIEGRSLSVINQILVATQKADATIVGGFRQWIKAGRVVKKGERGSYIWIPTVKKTDDADEVGETRFMLAPVFDVSQTVEIGAEVEAA